MGKLTSITIVFLLTLLFNFGAITPQVFASESVSTAPSNAFAYIISPQNGETVPETFAVKFGLSEMGIAPAGVERDNTGHHHLLIDVSEYPDLTTSLPATENIRHFGGGQTETQLTLTPGKHTLQLILGNYAHIPHDKPVISEQIEISVK